VEAIDEGAADEDHGETHHERAYHAPVEHAMLDHRGNLKKEKSAKDEEVVNGQGEFDDVSGEELQARSVPETEDDPGKDHRQGDPDRAPDRCLRYLIA